MPRISFDDPLPVGMESEGERMRVKVSSEQAGRDLPALINAQLPAGLRIVTARPAALSSSNPDNALWYRVAHDAGFDSEAIRVFHARTSWPHTRAARRGGHKIDLKQCIEHLRLEDSSLYLSIRPLDGHTIRPAEILVALFGFSGEALTAARICKLSDHCSQPR